MPSPHPHAKATAAAFDVTQEYCTPAVVFHWHPPTCFSQWTPSRFAVDGASYMWAEQFYAADKHTYSVTTTRFKLSCVCLTPPFTSNTDARYAILMPPCGKTSVKPSRSSASKLNSPNSRPCNSLGKALQIVRELLRNRAPPPVCHHRESPPRDDSTARGRHYIF